MLASDTQVRGFKISLLRDALWEGSVTCASVNLLRSVPRASYCVRKQCNTTGVRVGSTECGGYKQRNG